MNNSSFSVIWLSLLLLMVAMPAFSQVSNDNEDEVNKVDPRMSRNDFVPGQVLVKFKDTSTIQVRHNAKGHYQGASLSDVDKLLKEYGINDMEKLFPAEVAKPKSQLRRKVAPNGTIVQEKNLDKVFWIKTQIQRPDSTLQLIDKLKAMPEVEYAEPNYRVYITADMPVEQYEGQSRQNTRVKAPVATETEADVICPNPNQNPLYAQQYSIRQQNIDKLWDKPIINKKRPVIAILDTGVDINHPDLVDNIWQNTREIEGETAFDDDGNGIVDDKYGWNFVEDYYDLTDYNGHGTHCAGIAAAADNGIGIVGANPLALIMPVKVMSDRGEGNIVTIARGIVYAAENGADIISMSFGGNKLSNTMKESLDQAYLTSILVASAGNCGKDIYDVLSGGTMYPAAYYLVLGVEASDSNKQRAVFSNYDPDGPIYSEDGVDGRNYEVQVPGVGIYSTYPDGIYKQLSGTSMSAPLFAGAVSALQMVKEYPSKDVLFGDLIHLNADFAAIYSEETTRTPKIDLVALNVDDNVEGNSNVDGQVDVGETILFTPVLRNTWADATDITLSITVDPVYANFVEIENPEVNFGWSLSAYGQATARTPVKIKFANNIGDNTRIKFTLTICYANGTENFTQDVYVTINNMVKISGLIPADRTLTSDHIYLVNDNLGIMEGVTLTIEPGTRLEFMENIGLSSWGKLVAKGTPEKPIIFTGHKANRWKGIKSHASQGEHKYIGLYTNEDSTLFTLLPTEQTPNKVDYINKFIYYGLEEEVPSKFFDIKDYILDWDIDMTSKQPLLTDPNFLTPVILQLISEIKECCSHYSQTWSNDTPRMGELCIIPPEWKIYDNPRDSISYCKIEGGGYDSGPIYPYIDNCIIYDGFITDGERNNFSDIWRLSGIPKKLKLSNIINHNLGGSPIYYLPYYSDLTYNNFFNNLCDNYVITTYSEEPNIEKATAPSYLGTSREDFIRPHIYEMGNGGGFGFLDLSNMPVRPYAEAHGIVWKVVVNGKDAQDEYEDLAPLGVGRHKFEIYFNRPMNVTVAPHISFGVRDPWTQNVVAEDGSWSADSLVYTAYKTIDGKTKSDGVNRIYVYGAEDNEYFEIPYEKSRFNINIQAAGSMATGFMAEAGLGRVGLTWDNTNNNFDDAMGFNIYRYTINGEGMADTIRLNQQIVDIETTEYTDYDVTPGNTYYYMYKVLSTDLQEYDVSNVVAATPLTATMGDANGSGEADVADVITTVNYITGMNPKPFIFEAADMNKDLDINVLDVIGIIQTIMGLNSTSLASVEANSTYTIENGTLYVESSVALAGVQVQLALNEELRMKSEEFTVAEDLKGFEHTSAWLSENDYLFLAYNMNGKTLSAGKHALLNIGDAMIAQIRLSDAQGHNVQITGDDATRVNRMASDVMSIPGIYDLQGRKLTGNSEKQDLLPKGVYIIDGKKVVR